MAQKAAIYVKKHEYPIIQERAIPKPGPDELLLKVNSVGLNPIDWKIIEYGLAFATPPTILGSDVAGTVEEVGENVTNYHKGDRVVSWATRQDEDHAGHQQYALVGTAPFLTAKVPDNITDDEAAGLPTAINTADAALVGKDGFRYPSPFEGHNTFGKGLSFLVLGGSSIVALAAIQLLRKLGFSQIITTASPKYESLIKKYGATHIIDRSQSIDVQVEQIRSIAPSLDSAFNAVGNRDTDLVAARSFSSGGRIVSVLDVSKDVLAEYPGVSGNGIFGNPTYNVDTSTKAWTHLEEALRSGNVLPLPVKAGGGLENTVEALKAVKKAGGYRIVIHPQE